MERLGEVILFLCVVAIIFGGGTVYLFNKWNKNDAIRSSTIITPEIELVIKDNVVDTIYVYRHP